MKKFLDFYNKHKNIIISIFVILTIVFFLLPVITRRNMKIDGCYTTKEDVALYIIQYHELPPNYITMYGLDYLKGGNNNKKIYYDNYIVGGDTHINTNGLLDKGISESATLKECDIKGGVYDLTNNNRGSLRLVYTCNVKNVRVFYTADHYKSFIELSEFDLQLTSNIFWIIFGAYALAFIAFFIIINKWKRKNAN